MNVSVFKNEWKNAIFVKYLSHMLNWKSKVMKTEEGTSLLTRLTENLRLADWNLRGNHILSNSLFESPQTSLARLFNKRGGGTYLSYASLDTFSVAQIQFKLLCQ